ncbi:MAG: MGDG synthase family glycosyltransferase [Armatimonadota bacterium]
MKQKLLVIYANTGGGHLSAAKAIEAAIHLRYPEQYDVVILNVPTVCGSRRVRMLYESYNLMLKADPRYAKHGMRLLNTVNAEKVVIPLVPHAFQNVRRALLRERPNLVISVHAIVNHAHLRAMKECDMYGRVPYAIVCTDLTNNFLRGWANPEATRILTFTDLAKAQMCEFGVPAEKVTVHRGFTVNPAFFTDCSSKAECRTKLALQPDLFTILITMGGMAVPRKTLAVVRSLLKSGLPLQLVVICGMNRSLKRGMDRLARRTQAPLHVLGFTDQMAQLMTAADLMITKPGPGSIMEAVLKELPLLLDGVTEPMPQECGNLDYALAEGIAVKIKSYRRLPAIVDHLMHDPAEYQLIQENMRRIKNDNAIFDVVDDLLSLLPQPANTPG